MAIVKKTVLLLSLLVATLIACGYATAWARLEQCRRVTSKEVLQSKITGMNFGGEIVVLNEKDVKARISGPFQVETYFMVPADLHGVVHSRLFITLPWAIKPGESRKFYPV